MNPRMRAWGAGAAAAIVALLLFAAPALADPPPSETTSQIESPELAHAEGPADVVTRLPDTGNGLPPELEYRGGHLLAQALGGAGGAFLSLAATYWVARRRVKD